MYVAFYVGKGNWFDKLVRFWTRSNTSHVVAVFSDQRASFETNPPTFYNLIGTSDPKRGISLTYKEMYADEWQAVYVDADEAKVKQWFVDRIGLKYDWLGVLGFVFPPIKQEPKRWFCSEAVAAALGISDSWRFNPAALRAALLPKAGSVLSAAAGNGGRPRKPDDPLEPSDPDA